MGHVLLLVNLIRSRTFDLKLSSPLSSSLHLLYSTTAAPLNPNNGNSSSIYQTAQTQNPTEPLTKPQLKTLVLSQYSHGKFSNLIQNVVSLPSVLLSASQNLIPQHNSSAASTGTDPTRLESPLHQTVSKRFSIEEMGREIFDNRFDMEAQCVKLSAKGDPLVLPNLKLKVLIEAVRIVLEIIYDDRFVTFAYGGRVNMGRHTTIRYLKNSVDVTSQMVIWFMTHEMREGLVNNRSGGGVAAAEWERMERNLQ